VSEQFLSEIRIMSFSFAPKGWAQCNGQLLPISQNQALFALLGTTYGGNGQTTFALPNLQNRVPMHQGGDYQLGQASGELTHTLTQAETPAHSHQAYGTTSDGDSPIPAGNFLASADNLYAPLAHATTLHPTTVGNAGGGQAHDNMQPYLVLNFCIALVGIFPTRN
jgi:microcystin-dependent protein